MMNVFTVDYMTNEMMKPKEKVLRTEEVRKHLEEYVPVIHRMLADELGVDPKEVKILDWEYLGRE